MLASFELDRLYPEVVDRVNEIPLDEGRPHRMVQLDQEMETAT